jgi:anaerobic magnesium-protoporphyrin IX monomethyl ester cyclase
VGEGERMLLDILTKGCTQGIYRTTREQILKSNEIPVPDRSLIDMGFYTAIRQRYPFDSNFDFVPLGAKMACMMTSRGCPYSCIFCHNTWRGTPVRFWSPELMVQEAESLIARYGVHYIWFLDDDFFQNKARAAMFCELVIKKGLEIYWATSARPDSVDEELLSLAYRAGCRRISFGFESGSQRILDVLGKRSSVEENIAVANLCNKYKIEVCALIMIGNPTETQRDLDMTWKFIRSAKIDSIAINVTTPFPGTRLWKICEEKGYLPDHIDFASFYFTQAPIRVSEHFTTGQIESIKRRLLLSAYLLHPKIRSRFVIKCFRHPFLMFEKIADYFPFMKKGAV